MPEVNSMGTALRGRILLAAAWRVVVISSARASAVVRWQQIGSLSSDTERHNPSQLPFMRLLS
jgi:hypothetical protein